jgi:hypothetical protein
MPLLGEATHPSFKVQLATPVPTRHPTDDIVIRVSCDVAGSRIDMRSTSRQGRSDYGVNAARIRAYIGALRKRID